MLRKGFRRDFLILLASLIDEFEYQSIRYKLWRLSTGEDYRPQNFARSLSRILSVGDIEKIEKNGEVYFRLTSKGLKNLKESIPIFKFDQKAWDGYWRIVIFDINEKNKNQREALRDKLLSLGFGMWQKSVYITPYKIEKEINEYFQTNKMESSCVCLVAKRSDMGDDRQLAEKIWRLDDLNDEYEEFIFQCQKFLDEEYNGKEELSEFKKLWQWYKDLILKDPHLPEELLPSDWKGNKAKELFKKFLLKKTRSQPVKEKEEAGLV